MHNSGILRMQKRQRSRQIARQRKLALNRQKFADIFRPIDAGIVRICTYQWLLVSLISIDSSACTHTDEIKPGTCKKRDLAGAAATADL